MKKALVFLILIFGLSGCDNEAYDFNVINFESSESISVISDMVPESESSAVQIPEQLTALELCRTATNDYNDCKIKISGYISSADPEKKRIFLWYCDVGSYPFDFETFPEIDPLSNYCTIEGVCTYRHSSSIKFSDCTLISQEVKAPETVYWESDGSMIHFGNNCLIMSSANPGEIKSGVWDDALAAGCTETCHRCIKTEETELKPVDTRVYWTPSGKKIHSRKNCPTIVHSDTVFEGSISEAHNAGLTNYCDRCL